MRPAVRTALLALAGQYGGRDAPVAATESLQMTNSPPEEEGNSINWHTVDPDGFVENPSL